MPRLLAVALLLATGLTTLPATQAQPAVSLSYDGQTYTGDTLPAGLRQKLYELEAEFAEKRKLAIDEYVFNRFMRELAQDRGVSMAQLRDDLLAVEDPTADEVEQFYRANRDRIQGSLNEVRPQLTQYLRNQKLAQRQSQVLARIRQEKNYRVSLAEPQAPRFEVATAGYPDKGPASAPVTLVEFADYQCPHCKNARSAVNNLLERFGDRLRVVYRDFPINRSGISRKVALGAYCAGRQDAFWAYHDLAFDRQDYLKVVTPAMLAKELGLDAERFAACYEKPETEAWVAASEREGNRLGISGTPTFFVNGRRLQIHGDIEAELAKAIEAELAGES